MIQLIKVSFFEGMASNIQKYRKRLDYLPFLCVPRLVLKLEGLRLFMDRY